MAISDTISLMHTFRHWSRTVLGFNIDLISVGLCTLNCYQRYIADHTSIWLLTLICADRFFSIVYQNRFNLFKKRSFQITMVIAVVIFSALININMPLNYQLKEIEPNGNSSQKACACLLPSEVHTHISLLNIASLSTSATINFALSLKTILYIHSSRRRNRRANVNRSDLKDQMFVVSSIWLNLMGFLLKIPALLTILIANHFKLDTDLSQLLFTATMTIAKLDNLDLFLINMLVNSFFKREFFRMFATSRQRQREDPIPLTIRNTNVWFHYHVHIILKKVFCFV